MLGCSLPPCSRWWWLCRCPDRRLVRDPRLMTQDPLMSWLPWLYLLLPFALAMLLPPVLTAIVDSASLCCAGHVPDHPVTLRVVLASPAYAVGTYFFFGVHLWLLADNPRRDSPSARYHCASAHMGIAMLAGLAAFMLPSGVGAREFVIIVALTPVVGVGAATAYAGVSRAMFILAEIGAAGVAAAVAVWLGVGRISEPRTALDHRVVAGQRRGDRHVHVEVLVGAQTSTEQHCGSASASAR